MSSRLVETPDSPAVLARPRFVDALGIADEERPGVGQRPLAIAELSQAP